MDSIEKEQLLFIKVLSDHINRLKTAPFGNVDWGRIQFLAKTHELGGVIYHQCKDFIPESYISDFEKQYSVALFYYANRTKVLNLISKCLNRLDYCFVKGPVVAQYYPLPPLRTMGDCDVLVTPNNYYSAVESLLESGFVSNEAPHKSDWVCTYQGMTFELHNALVKKKEYVPNNQDVFFNDFGSYIKDNLLDWNFHFLFLIMHLRKHFMGGGVGIRQFMDLAVIISNGPSLNWLWINHKLEELRLQRFAYACFDLISDWFHVVAPVDFVKINEKTKREVTSKIMNNGVFGFADEENSINKASNAILLRDGLNTINRISYLFSNLFPSYDRLVNYPGCGFLIGKKYLLPFAWLKRFVYIITQKDNRRRINTMNSSFVSKSSLKERKRMLSDMGLID